jgi:hypothetical protein
MDTLKFAVGETSPVPLSAQGTLWLTSRGGYTLLYSTGDATETLVDAWFHERLEMTARTTDSYVHITYRLGDSCWWGDCMPTGQDFEPADMPERCAEGFGTPIVMVLIDAPTQRVLSLRTCTASTRFSNYLLDGLNKTRSSGHSSYIAQATAAQVKDPDWHAARAKELMVWPGRKQHPTEPVTVDWERLEDFRGTERYHRPGFGDVVLTDGVHYLAQHGLARLVGHILQQQNSSTIAEQLHQVWSVRPSGDGSNSRVECRPAKESEEHVTDVLCSTSVPIDLGRQIELWVIDKVMLLPGEY